MTTSTADSRRPFKRPSTEGEARQLDEVAFMAAAGHLRCVGDEAGCDWSDWDSGLEPPGASPDEERSSSPAPGPCDGPAWADLLLEALDEKPDHDEPAVSP